MKRRLWAVLALLAVLGAGVQQGLAPWEPSGAPPRAAVEAPLPEQAEIDRTLRLIDRDEAFPHDRDGALFYNREDRLPERPRGYYREYTVATPGLDHRGARRIVTGGDPPEVFYYTDDHYRSFVLLEDRR